MEYLKRVLGIEVLYENKALEHLPNFISTRYDSQKVSLNGQKTVFLYPKTELEQVETLKKHLERVKKVADCPVILVLEQITARQKEYLLREKIAFIVDGGIFTMALVEALHYYGIASCILQNGEYKERNLKFKEICKNIPENEKIILFIAIGYYKDNFTYAVSHRKNLEDVLIIR